SAVVRGRQFFLPRFPQMGRHVAWTMANEPCDPSVTCKALCPPESWPRQAYRIPTAQSFPDIRFRDPVVAMTENVPRPFARHRDQCARCGHGFADDSGQQDSAAVRSII